MDDLWKQTVKHITDGAYFRVEEILGGGDAFDNQIIDWLIVASLKRSPKLLLRRLHVLRFWVELDLSRIY
jgi:hypothetical protein